MLPESKCVCDESRAKLLASHLRMHALACLQNALDAAVGEKNVISISGQAATRPVLRRTPQVCKMCTGCCCRGAAGMACLGRGGLFAGDGGQQGQ